MRSTREPRPAELTLGVSPGPLALQVAAQVALDTLSDAALLDLVGEIERSLSWAAGLRAEVIAAYASRGECDPRDASTEQDLEWHRERLAAVCQTSPHEALVRTDTALALRDRLPVARAALGVGSLPWAQAVALARETAELDVDQSAVVERLVLADPRVVAVHEVVRAARSAVAALAPTIPAEQAASAHELRSLQMWPDRDIPGLVCLQARFPTDAAAVLAASLDSLAVRGGPDDLRTADQRRADALVDLATGAQPPVVALQVLVHGATGETGVPARAGAATVEGRPISGQALWRLGCAASVAVSPVTVAGTVGAVAVEDRRVPGAAMRRRLEARDGGCRFPGCPTRARRCHAHHLRHWADGGPTVDANLVLICSRHHHAVHEGGWSLTGPPERLRWTDGDGRSYVLPPDAATLRPWLDDPPLVTRLHPIDPLDDPPDPPDPPGPDPLGPDPLGPEAIEAVVPAGAAPF